MRTACNFCGNQKFQNKEVQYIYRHNGNFLIVNDVPSEECTYCGEQYFKSDVLKKIEQDFRRIYTSHGKPKHMVEVPVEEFAQLK
ncbi:MAG: YgiT-type zinc finger protein [Planctomycetota bacterium]